MRGIIWLFLLQGLLTQSAVTQQTPAANTELTSTQKPLSPTPEKEGFYRIKPGITPPVLINAAPAPSAKSISNCLPSTTLLTAVVDVDGMAKVHDVMDTSSSKCTELATTMVQQTAFRAGTLNGVKVPVLVCVSVPLLDSTEAPIVNLEPCPFDPDAKQPLQSADPGVPPPCPSELNEGIYWKGAMEVGRDGVTSPKVTYAVDPKFSTEAREYIRNNHLKGFIHLALIMLVVDQSGKPKNLCLRKSAGLGLDAEAAKSVLSYRFIPATKDGIPVPVRVTVEVRFRW